MALWLCGLSVVFASMAGAQDPAASRVTDRMRTLLREADQLAQQSRTLVGELRALEIDRDLKREALQQVEADLASATAALQQTDARIAALEAARVAQQPGLEARLVEIYKRGRAGYVRLLLGASDLRQLGRATRAVAALASVDRQRVAEHRRTLAALGAERDVLERRNQRMTALRLQAREAEAVLRTSIAAHGARLAEIDARRDLTAQLLGELGTAQARLQQALSAVGAGGGASVVVPLAPFRGAFDWPAPGPLLKRFGPDRGPRTALVAATRNGIDIAAPEGTAVRAVHPGTVTYAEPFTGFGNLVVVDHGDDDQSVYGYLSAIAVTPGQHVEAGAELGRSGTAPAGPAAVYFELRIDGTPTDPLQWLKAR